MDPKAFPRGIWRPPGKVTVMGVGMGVGGSVEPGGPRHLFFHPTDMETSSTSYINLERVDTSRMVGDTSPGP